jgi:hypothetical protein
MPHRMVPWELVQLFGIRIEHGMMGTEDFTTPEPVYQALLYPLRLIVQFYFHDFISLKRVFELLRLSSSNRETRTTGACVFA